jgi:uncharacterized protein (TIGR04376 family)
LSVYKPKKNVLSRKFLILLIKNWFDRVQKATAAGRSDLATAAQDRVNALLPQGNQLWGKMKGLKDRTLQAQSLLQTIKDRRTEVKAKAAAAKIDRDRVDSSNTSGSSWGSVNNYTSASNFADPLDAKFRQWEADEELDQLKRNLGK